jgi:homoserine kinase
MRLQIEVPATSANLGPGFDALGLAIDLCNRIDATLGAEGDEVELAEVTGDSSQPLDPRDNLLCAAYRRWGQESGKALPGARFSVDTQIPIGRGLGASAAAIVAGLSAAAFAESGKLPRGQILRLASVMEGHSDNAVAAVLGGMTVAFMDGEEVPALNVVNHASLGIALFIPAAPLLTADARACLPTEVAVGDAVANIGRTAYLTTAMIWGRWELFAPAMRDRLHQPYRARLLPALEDVIAAAEAAGAYGASLSGGGPSVIAFCPREQTAAVTAAMGRCAAERDWPGRGLATRIRHLGVQVKRVDDQSVS